MSLGIRNQPKQQPLGLLFFVAICMAMPYNINMDKNKKIEIAERVKKLRKKCGLSQGTFAGKYHIPKATLQDWEHGRRTPPEYVVELLEKNYEMEKYCDKRKGAER